MLFRSFEKPSDALALGCSFTFGTGLPQEFIWAEIFAKKNNFTLHNLASAGSSTTEQVTRAFHYIKKVGKPKIIIAMLPILRISCPVNIHRFYPKNINIKNKNINVYNANLDINNFEIQSEAPHDPNKILPIEFTIYYSILFIKMLKQYCESLNIKFIWSFWEDFDLDLVYRIIEIIKKNNLDENLFENYCNLNINAWKLVGKKNNKLDIYTGNMKDCHKEFNDHPLFHTAADRTWEQPGLHSLYEENQESAHWGIHRHLHIAEIFDEKFRTTL